MCGFGAFAQTPNLLLHKFRLHLVSEPTTLAPYPQKNSSNGYFLGQIYASLLDYENGKLVGDLARECSYKKPTVLECELRPGLKWSNGKPITGDDFVKGFREFISEENKSFRADLLFPVLNAEAIFRGDKKSSSLGVKVKANRLTFTLTKPDPEFIYHLTSGLLTPLPPDEFPEKAQAATAITSGPYVIDSWLTGQKIVLKPNPHYWQANPDRPQVELLFISEDTVALNLYQKGELELLRRLPTLFIPQWRGKPEYHEVEQFRFDYIGFSEKLREQKDLRKAVTQSLDYSELQELFYAKPRPGCPGIPKYLRDKDICLDFDKTKATAAKAKLGNLPTLTYAYSKQGGDDHDRASEWLQSQLRTNLGLNVALKSLENKIFLQQLTETGFDLFRKGIGPERPTCLAALEVFTPGNQENFLKLNDPVYNAIVEQLRGEARLEKKKRLCDQGIDYLLSNALLIPTGPIFFTLLVKPEWQGWKLNDLNHLNLSMLKKSSTKN